MVEARFCLNAVGASAPDSFERVKSGHKGIQACLAILGGTWGYGQVADGWQCECSVLVQLISESTRLMLPSSTLTLIPVAPPTEKGATRGISHSAPQVVNWFGH